MVLLEPFFGRRGKLVGFRKQLKKNIPKSSGYFLCSLAIFFFFYHRRGLTVFSPCGMELTVVLHPTS